MVQNQNLAFEEVKNQKEVGAMEVQGVKLYEKPIIISPIVLEEYEETITEGIKVKVRKMKDDRKEYFDIHFRNYIIRVEGFTSYYGKMAIYGLLMCEKRLLANGYVEGIVDWDDKDWAVWDPYRLFTKGEFKIFREGNYERQEGDALIDLEVRRIYAPHSENKLKVYIKAFMMPAPHIE
jgi:hypothetical protein